MRWLRRVGVGAVALVLLALAGAGFALWRLHRLVTTSPVAEPTRPLLEIAEAAPTLHSAPPAWEQRARADQQAAFDLATFQNPPREYAPWTRWWWPGNVVDRDELLREVALFAENGFGGVEVQAFGVNVSAEDRADPRWREHGWDSPAFYENLRAVLDGAREHGLGVDLNNGSGWPSGGPHVGLDDGSRTLVFSERCADGPRTLEERPPRPSVPFSYYMGGGLAVLMGDPNAVFLAERATLLGAVAGRVLRDGRTWSPADLEDSIALDPASLAPLALPANGEPLRWEVPDGRWCAVFSWEMPGGELVSADAIPDAAFVADHLDGPRVRANLDYLLGARTGLPPYYGAPLRAYFDDSLEFKLERHFARGQLAEFARRRGYDATPWLPALAEPGADQMWFHVANLATAPAYDLDERGRRFAEDWASLTSDLFIERFLAISGGWARERGLAHRAQAYGAPIDVLRAAGAADIPEAEQLYAGGSELFLKAVSSGAHLYDRPLVSAESFVFSNRAFLSTPAKLKALADYALASGINQVIYHGSAYQVREPVKRGYPPEGWYPWVMGMFSEDWTEQSPYWRYAGDLNRYVARVQYALRLGRPETDVLVLFPGLGFPQGFYDPTEPFDQGRFAGEPELTGIRDLSALFTLGAQRRVERRDTERMRRIGGRVRALAARGVHWEWVNEDALVGARLVDGVLVAGAQRARALLVAEIDAIAPETAERIAELAAAGVPVRIEGAKPQRALGLADAERADARVRDAIARVETANARELRGALGIAGGAVRSIRRRLANGDSLVFLHSASEQPAALAIAVEEPFSRAVALDAWDGSATEVRRRDGDGRIALALAPFGSRVLLLERSASAPLPAAAAPAEREITAREIDEWSLRFDGDATSRDLPRSLFDWRDDPRTASRSAPGTYAATLALETVAPGHRHVLDLGRVGGAAEVRVNGSDAGHALVYPFSIDVTRWLKAGVNALEVVVIPPRRNALAARIEAGDAAYAPARFVGATHRVAAGLLGPVVLRELAPQAAAE
jgi:hypothetical protein